MKTFVFLAAIIAVFVLAAVFAPTVIQAADRVIGRTIVRSGPAVRVSSQRYERVYASDCSGSLRGGNCAGSFSSNCDVGASSCDLGRSSNCDGTVSVRRRSGVRVIIAR